MLLSLGGWWLVPLSALMWQEGLDPGLKLSDQKSLPLLAIWIPPDAAGTLRDQWTTETRRFPQWWNQLPNFVVPVLLKLPSEASVLGLNPQEFSLFIYYDGVMLHVWHTIPPLLVLSHEISKTSPLKRTNPLADPYAVPFSRLVSMSGKQVWQRQADGPFWMETVTNHGINPTTPRIATSMWTEQTTAGPLLFLKNQQGEEMALPLRGGWSWVQEKDGSWKAGLQFEPQPALGGQESQKPLH